MSMPYPDGVQATMKVTFEVPLELDALDIEGDKNKAVSDFTSLLVRSMECVGWGIPVNLLLDIQENKEQESPFSDPDFPQSEGIWPVHE